MPKPSVTIGQRKKIALIAHDNKKTDLLDWVKFNKGTLLNHELFATGTTGKLLEKELGCEITIFESGPLGGDQQIGSRIAEGAIDFLIFFWDPLEPLPHDPDIKALLRVAADPVTAVNQIFRIDEIENAKMTPSSSLIWRNAENALQ